jgi:hypothetical protein
MSRVRILTFLWKKGQDVGGAYISIGRRHFGIFVDLEYFVQAQLLLGLRIFCVRRNCFLDLEYFMSADIFDRRRHFRAPTFCIGRRHLERRHFT